MLCQVEEVQEILTPPLSSPLPRPLIGSCVASLAFRYMFVYILGVGVWMLSLTGVADVTCFSSRGRQ